jgi:hypothetical protein
VAKISERPLALSRAAAINASKHELDEIELRLQIESRANVALVAEAATALIYAGCSGKGLYVSDPAPSPELAREGEHPGSESSVELLRF